MKIKQLVTIAAFLVAVALVSPSAQALTAAQAKAVKKAVTSVPVPEMPAKAAELVTQAAEGDREAVAVAVVRAAIYKSRSSAPQVVAAIAKAAPKLAPIVSQAAAQMEVRQAGLIARAAIVAAPEAKTEITQSVNRGAAMGAAQSVAAVTPTTTTVPANPTFTQPTPTLAGPLSPTVVGPLAPTPSASPILRPGSTGNTHTGADHGGGHGTVNQQEIFPGYPATAQTATPTVKDYTLPRSL